MATLALRILILCSLVSARVCAAEATGPRLEVEKTTRQTESLGRVEFEIGTILVPENRNVDESRMIKIGFARYAAQGAKKDAPPIFVLPGGPGISMVEPIERLHPSIQSQSLWPDDGWLGLRKFGDLIFVDQRGFSNRGDVLVGDMESVPLKPDQPQSIAVRVAEYRKFATSFMQEYKQKDVDLRGYTVLECADDVNDLRTALGYKKIRLYGSSFGSQWALTVIRRHPKIVENAVLLGVLHLGSNFPLPTHFLAAAKRRWKAAENDPRFKPYLPEGGIEAAAETVMQRLEKLPEIKERKKVFGFAIGEPKTVAVLCPSDFPWDLSPRKILSAYHGKAPAPDRGESSEKVILINHLIQASIGVSAKRLREVEDDPAGRFCLKSQFLHERYIATKDLWSDADIGDENRKPIESDVPVLFIHGDWDLQTPIENTHEIAKYFKNRHVIVVGGGTHYNLMSRKLIETMDGFLRNGSLESLPAYCAGPSKLDPPTFEVAEGIDQSGAAE